MKLFSQAAAPFVFFLSGAASLGYQLVWTRLWAVSLGHEVTSLVSVLFALFMGLSCGGLLYEKALRQRDNPGLIFALAEGVVGSWAVIAAFVLLPVGNIAAQWIGPETGGFSHWLIAILFPFLSLAPATIAMGAIMPAMDHYYQKRAADQDAPPSMHIAWVYGLNTLGAVIGVCLTTTTLMPSLGLRGALFALAVGNGLSALIAWMFLRSSKPTPVSTIATSIPLSIATRLAALGLLGIAFELWATRMLSQFLENTVYTYAAILAVCLLGISLGALLTPKLVRILPQLRFSTMVSLVALLCALSALTLPHLPANYARLRDLLGHDFGSTLLSECLIAACVCLLPAMAMGSAFTLLSQMAPEGRFGYSLAWNTMGAGLGSSALFLFPHLGAKWYLAAVCAGYLGLVTSRHWTILLVPIALLITVFAVIPARSIPVSLAPGATLLLEREGLMGSVAVIQGADKHKVLRVNNRFQMGGTAAAIAEERHAHIPLLLHGSPRRALFLGLGTGITFRAAEAYPDLVSEGVELLSEIIGAMPYFASAPINSARQSVHIADARRFVRTTPHQYDVVVADLFHPAMDGVGLLYSLEHFQAIKARLTQGGIFCQWLPLHQMDDATFRMITRTFTQVFPETYMVVLRFNVDTPVVGLISANAALSDYQLETLERFLAHRPLALQLRRVNLADSVRLLGHFIAGPADIQAWSARSQLNTDLHPRVLFNAARASYLAPAPSDHRLTELLNVFGNSVPVSVNPHLQDRLRAFSQGRLAYLQGAEAEAAGRIPEAIDGYIRSASASPDFTIGYAQCLNIAMTFSETKPEFAREILQKLVIAQPSNQVAAKMLERLR